MKTIRHRLTNEIEYLRALAEMYEHESNTEAKEAAVEAIEALERLSNTIVNKPEAGGELLPLAA